MVKLTDDCKFHLVGILLYFYCFLSSLNNLNTQATCYSKPLVTENLPLRTPETYSIPVPTPQTDFPIPNPKAMYSLLFLSPLKNLNKLPPYVSEGVPWEEGQEEYSADRTQTLTSSNIAGMLWCSPYAHLALAGICWQHSSISPVRFFIFFHMFSIWGAEARGGWSW